MYTLVMSNSVLSIAMLMVSSSRWGSFFDIVDNGLRVKLTELWFQRLQPVCGGTAQRKIFLLANWSVVVVVYPLPWPLLVGGVRCSRLWSTSQLLRPSGQQCSHSGGVCPQIQGRQCGAYVGAVEEMMCVVCVDVTEGA